MEKKIFTKLNKLRPGDTISVSSYLYALSYNYGLKNSRNKKDKRITDLKVAEWRNEGKLSRPVLVIFNNPHHKYMICSSLTTKKKKPWFGMDITNFSDYKNNKHIKSKVIKYEILIINKNKMSLNYFPHGLNKFNTLDKSTVNKFLKEYESHKPNEFNYIINLKKQIKLEVDLIMKTKEISDLKNSKS